MNVMSNIFKNVIKYFGNDNNTFSQYFGMSQLWKACKLFGGRKTPDKKITSYNFFIYKNFQRKFLFCFNQPSLADIIVKPPQPFLATTKGDSPLETPNSCFSFYFLFLLLVVISFGYLAIYTNEHLLLLNNVDTV